MVMMLCEVGADVNCNDKDGLTPLMWAAKRDHCDICVVLMRFNAKHNRRSREGFSALDYAIMHGNYNSAYILFEYDKEIQEPISYATLR